jgi:hypothetical protein
MSLVFQHTAESAAPAGSPAAMGSLPERIFGMTSVACVVLAVFVFFCVPRGISDPDIWWHLRDAQILVSSHRFITHDLFSYTAAGAAWMNHEWLAELPFYAGWAIDGVKGVYTVTLLAVECIMFSIFALAYARSRSLGMSLLVTIIAALLSTVSYGPRTLLFGWICLMVELAILQAAERRSSLVWWLPALYVVWVNTHGSWVIGLVLLAAYILARAFRFQAGLLSSDGLGPGRLGPLVLAGVLSIAALFANPYGWRLVAYPFNLAFHQKLNIANVEEWRSLDFHSPRGKIMLASLVALALWQLVRQRAWKLDEVAFLAIGIYSALTYSRFLFLFAILAAPIIAAKLARPAAAPARLPAGRPLLNAAFMLVLAGLVFGQLRHRAPVPRPDAPVYPSAAAMEALGKVPRGAHVLNDYRWGGFIIWHQPTLPVFIDSRVDIFEYNGTFKDYLDIVHLNGSLQLLDRHEIRYVFFPASEPLVYLLQHTAGWKTDFANGKVVLLERTAAGPGV